jgi:hypothetical protein
MSDPAIERALEVKQYAEHLEKEVAKELRLFEDAIRKTETIQSELRSMSAQMLSTLEGVSKERDRQKTLMSLNSLDGSDASAAVVSIPPPTAHIAIHLAERWIPAVQTAETMRSVSAAPAVLGHTSVTEPLNSEFWELLAAQTSNPWAESVPIQPVELNAPRNPQEQRETERETQRNA